MQEVKEIAKFAGMRRLAPEVTGALVRMRQKAYKDGAVPAKYKILTALAISVAIRCEPCIKGYVKMAKEQGVRREELLEFLEVAMTMQGCPGEEWSIKALSFWEEAPESTPDVPSVGSCCAPLDNG